VTSSDNPSPGPGALPIAYWTERWDVRDGVFHIFYVDRDGQRNKENFFKVISLSKTKFVIQDMYHGRNTGTWTRR
jgi:hypothetical protein